MINRICCPGILSLPKQCGLRKSLLPIVLLSIALGLPTIATAQCDGTFAAIGSFAVNQVFGAITTGDFNGDEITDLATAGPVTDDVSVLLGIGDGTFSRPRLFPQLMNSRRESRRAISTATGTPIWRRPMAVTIVFQCCWAMAMVRFRRPTFSPPPVIDPRQSRLAI